MIALIDAAVRILKAGDPGWDDARQAWNLAVDQQPAAVALPTSAQDVVDAVRFARENGLRIAAQGTGHNAGPLGPLADTLLLKTSAMRGVSVDPDAKLATIEAGALAEDVGTAAAEHGLAWLTGTSPDVGVIGYTIGGGISWFGRRHGLAANHVDAVEVVTADGQFLRVDRDHELDLFWALRGGGGSFAIVTKLELRLIEIREVYAGQLWWPADADAAVLRAWGALTQADVPDEFTSAVRLMNFPDAPALPDHLRGQSFVIVFVCHVGRPADADSLLAPLRALGPTTDTTETIPVTALSQLHMDPAQPTAALGDALMLTSLPSAALDAFLDAAGPNADDRPIWAELMQLGGAIKRPHPLGGALAAIDADYQFTVGASAASPQAAEAGERSVAAATNAIQPWTAPRMYLNLAANNRDPATFWTPDAYERLRQIKAAVDPDNLIRSNHPVPAL